jgi:hypothetical protein
MISKPIVRSAQIVLLSFVKFSSISKWTDSSFHMSLVTKEYHLVHLERFLSYSMFGANRATILHQD